MRYCQECANTLNYAISFISHREHCEKCHKERECYDVIAHQNEITPTTQTSRRTHNTPRYRCSHCDEEIEHLRYNSTIYESGNYYIENEECCSDDSETDSEDYFCPECNHEIYDPSDSEEIIPIEEEIDDSLI